MSVEEFFKLDRQWTRNCRVAYAKAQLAKATTLPGRAFWAEVLERLL